jgi:citrate synthase
MSEELETPIGFALSYQATREQRYTGTVPEGFVPDQKL